MCSNTYYSSQHHSYSNRLENTGVQLGLDEEGELWQVCSYPQIKLSYNGDNRIPYYQTERLYPSDSLRRRDSSQMRRDLERKAGPTKSRENDTKESQMQKALAWGT